MDNNQLQAIAHLAQMIAGLSADLSIARSQIKTQGEDYDYAIKELVRIKELCDKAGVKYDKYES